MHLWTFRPLQDTYLCLGTRTLQRSDRAGHAVQVLLLLKSSDRVMHDICHAFAACPAVPGARIAHTLALRRWVPLKPQRELRCFVRQRDLVGAPVLNKRELHFHVWYFLGVPASALAKYGTAQSAAHLDAHEGSFEGVAYLAMMRVACSGVAAQRAGEP